MPKTLLAVSTQLAFASVRRSDVLSCSHRFPLGSPHQSERTIVDGAVDSFGSLVSLVAFHEIPSRCNTTAEDAALQEQPFEGEADFETEGAEDKDEKPEVEGQPAPINIPETPGSTSGLAAHKEHPHIITRCVFRPVSCRGLLADAVECSTHLRVVDETRLFNRKAYNKAHHELKTTSVSPQSFSLL